MGYTTDFTGRIYFSKPLTEDQVAYLQAFNRTRRMERNPDVADTFADPKRLAVRLPIGRDGGYFVGSENDFGQTRDASVTDYNSPPGGQPGLWCGWTVTAEYLEHDGGEKFYNYVEWLQYLIQNFFEPWGVRLNGEISWIGEDSDDTGIIVVTNSNVEAHEILDIRKATDEELQAEINRRKTNI